MNAELHDDFDCLSLPHVLHKTKKEKDMSWECYDVVDYFKEKGDDHSSYHKCLVEWNNVDINMTKS
jgi:hypothetical protein